MVEPPAQSERRSPAPLHQTNGSTPIPDPTERTTEAMLRSIDALRVELKGEINGDKRVFETRLSAMDQAITLVRKEADQLPNRMDEKIDKLASVNDIQFEAIQNQFREREVRIDQTSRDAKTAIDAALQAQEKQAIKQAEVFDKATSKSEDQFTKQIDGLGTLIETKNKALEDRITDLSARFNRGEGVIVGVGTQRSASQDSGRYFIAILGAIIGVAGLVAGVVLALVK